MRNDQLDSVKIKNSYLDPVYKLIAERSEKPECDTAVGFSRLVISIDGRSGSGKTTAARSLAEACEASVIHMDDFFLPPALRTAERTEEPGGNVHYERFAAEVLPFIRRPEPFSYGIFDCGRMDIKGQSPAVAGKIIIVEGSYSSHPVFGNYQDIKVFMDIDSSEQMCRISSRNGAEKAAVFKDRWIPLEEKYFDYFNIPGSSDIIIKAVCS